MHAAQQPDRVTRSAPSARSALVTRLARCSVAAVAAVAGAVPAVAAVPAMAATTASARPMTTAATPAGPAAVPGPFPTHVFAPYFETYQPDSLAAAAAASGARYLTLAFLQTPRRGSCAVTWDGDVHRRVSATVYGTAITRIRSRGGDVVASFGGWSADHGGTDIADSCPSPARVAAAYEHVVATYGLRRIDLDVEDASLTDRAGIVRRDTAVVLLQRWARAHHRPLQVEYTLPSTPTGLDAQGLAVVVDARRRGVRLDVVDAMTFDFYDGARHPMARAAESAALGLVAQLGRVLPGSSARDRWGRVGITTMIGIDDEGRDEVLVPAGALGLRRWATARGVDTLSFWALQRDDGGCPGHAGSDTCSGIAQSRWQFTHLMAPFTR